MLNNKEMATIKENWVYNQFKHVDEKKVNMKM